jgi:hypothetical protein
MTPRYDRLRIAVWAVILAVCLVTAYATVALLVSVGEIIIPPIWSFVQAHTDGLTALVVLAMLAIVGKGIMEA